MAGSKSGLMRPIFSPRNLPLLKKFASANVLAAFDFDGTLAPIVSKPEEAALGPGTQHLLKQLASLYSCIVVSGRGRDDLRRKLRGIQLKEVIGNHGIEPWHTSLAMTRAVKRWIPFLKRGLDGFPGVVLENKHFSVTVHYRSARNKRAARKAITDIARTLPGAKLVGGKQVVNILTEAAPGKGVAVERARQEMNCDKVIYVGDEKTDEDVFALARRGRTLTIRVGASKSSSAHFYIRDQREIDRLLRTLIELRTDQRERRQ
jgi:trehalose 6-phosphate phosphatase